MHERRTAMAMLALFVTALSCSSSSGGPGECDGKCDALVDASLSDADPNAADASSGAFCDQLGSFPSKWISGGPDCGTEPEIQVHQLNADTFILRQSLCTSGEAPFFYLLFGDDKALLEDTGAGGIDLVGTVGAIVAQREAAVGHAIELVVVNSHAHGDHTQSNAAFANAGATVVGFKQSQITAFFGMAWPRSPISYDLGARVVDIMGIPGHQADHIAIYDRQYGFLLTGDTLYPGRLFIDDFTQFKASVSFLVDFTSTREVCAVLGTHIELSTTPGQDYQIGVQHHPNERALLLSRDTLLELNAAVQAMGNTAVRETHDDFIVFPL